jgi:hypothetical protein
MVFRLSLLKIGLHRCYNYLTTPYPIICPCVVKLYFSIRRSACFAPWRDHGVVSRNASSARKTFHVKRTFDPVGAAPNVLLPLTSLNGSKCVYAHITEPHVEECSVLKAPGYKLTVNLEVAFFRSKRKLKLSQGRGLPHEQRFWARPRTSPTLESRFCRFVIDD